VIEYHKHDNNTYSDSHSHSDSAIHQTLQFYLYL